MVNVANAGIPACRTEMVNCKICGDNCTNTNIITLKSVSMVDSFVAIIANQRNQF